MDTYHCADSPGLCYTQGDIHVRYKHGHNQTDLDSRHIYTYTYADTHQ
jgi:hypothetical protein